MKKNQVVIGWILFVVTIAFIAHLHGVKTKLGLFAVTGVGFGYVLQRSRFGFAGTVRKLAVMGNGSLFKAVMLLVIISTIISAGIQYTAFMNGDVIPGISSVKTINLAAVWGGILFGIGMIFAGGCASGTLTDIGEGYIRSIVVLVFFCLGSVLGVAHMGALKDTILMVGPKLYMPEYLGYFGAVKFFLVIYIITYFAIRKYEAKRKAEGTFIEETYADWEKPMEEDGEFKVFSFKTYHKLFVERWSFTVGAGLIAGFGILVLVTAGKNWGVTTTFTYWGAWIIELFGGDVSNIGYFQSEKAMKILSGGFFNDAGSMRNLGLIIGSLMAALLAGGLTIDRNFKVKHVLSYIIGGLIMGYGARFSSGCNAGAFYSSLISLSFSGVLFGIYMTIGGLIGLKLVEKFDL